MTEETREIKRDQYQDKFRLLNKSELVLYERLIEAVPAYYVFSQVSMSQLFHIRNYRQSGFLQIAEIGRKSVDFLLCRKDTSIVLAIELNGPTHERDEQKARDEKKRIALEEAGIPLLVLDPAAIPEGAELRRQIAHLVAERRGNEARKQAGIAHAVASRKAPDAATPETKPTHAKKKFWFKRRPKP